MDQLRTVHKLTMKMKREIVLGSSSIDDPPQFISVKTRSALRVPIFFFINSFPLGIAESQPAMFMQRLSHVQKLKSIGSAANK
jgi:hypothetical protein